MELILIGNAFVNMFIREISCWINWIKYENMACRGCNKVTRAIDTSRTIKLDKKSPGE